MQHSSINQGNSEKRLVGIFPRLFEILEARVGLGVFHSDGPHLLGDQSRKPFIQAEAQSPDRLRTKADGSRQHEAGSVRLEQIYRAHLGLKSPSDQLHHIYQGLCWFTALAREVAYLLESKDIPSVAVLAVPRHVLHSFAGSLHLSAWSRHSDTSFISWVMGRCSACIEPGSRRCNPRRNRRHGVPKL